MALESLTNRSKVSMVEPSGAFSYPRCLTFTIKMILPPITSIFLNKMKTESRAKGC